MNQNISEITEEELDAADTRELLLTAFDHDLKNLETLANGYRELVEETEDEQKIQAYQEKIWNAEENIRDLYKNFENLGDSHHLDFQELIGESLSMLHPKIQKEDKNVTIDWNTECAGEHDLLTERMIYNLLDNSLDHGETDIYIEINETPEYLEMNVSDGGELTPEEWDNLFPENSQKEEYLSTGSYIIDQISEKKNIEIQQGLEFDYTVKIPY